jgi:hypothetical protein
MTIPEESKSAYELRACFSFSIPELGGITWKRSVCPQFPAIDPNGLDCTYMNDSGTGAVGEENGSHDPALGIIDHNSNQSVCTGSGAYNGGFFLGSGPGNGIPTVITVVSVTCDFWCEAGNLLLCQTCVEPIGDSLPTSLRPTPPANNGTPQNQQQHTQQHQQCVQAATAKANSTASDTIWTNIALPFKNAGKGAVSGGIIGCVLTVEGGCVEGAIPGAITGFVGGALEGTGEAIYRDIRGYSQAMAQLQMDIAACPP